MHFTKERIILCPTKGKTKSQRPRFHSIILEGEKLAIPLQTKWRSPLTSVPSEGTAFAKPSTIPRLSPQNQLRRKTTPASRVSPRDNEASTGLNVTLPVHLKARRVLI